jgi:hypothetical protein
VPGAAASSEAPATTARIKVLRNISDLLNLWDTKDAYTLKTPHALACDQRSPFDNSRKRRYLPASLLSFLSDGIRRLVLRSQNTQSVATFPFAAFKITRETRLSNQKQEKFDSFAPGPRALELT